MIRGPDDADRSDSTKAEATTFFAVIELTASFSQCHRQLLNPPNIWP